MDYVIIKDAGRIAISDALIIPASICQSVVTVGLIVETPPTKLVALIVSPAPACLITSSLSFLLSSTFSLLTFAVRGLISSISITLLFLS